MADLIRDDNEIDADFENDPQPPEGIPVLPLRDVVIFPHMVVPLGVVRDRTVRALQAARLEGSNVLALAQRDAGDDDPGPQGMYRIGTVARPVQVLELPDGTLRVLLEGLHRAKVTRFVQRDPFYRALAEPLASEEKPSRRLQAMMRSILSQFEEATSLSRSIPPEALVTAMNVDEAGRLADLVGAYINIKLADKQGLLEMLEVGKRVRLLDHLLAGELDILRLERDIHARVHDELEDSQREHYLREQLKAIQDELGETSGMADDIEDYRERVIVSGMSAEALEKSLRELDRLEQMPMASPEVSVIRTYLDWLLDLPWTTETPDQVDILRAEQLMDQDHYGLKKVKERVLEFLAVRQLVEEVRGPILCFMGPPGVGKTSIGRSIARAMGREFVRVSLGGVHDEAEIRGHRRTYVGALPGRFIQALRRVKSDNPVFMIDEIDKIGTDFRGDPTSALLEVLDPEQNDTFRDHYLEVAYDLSKIMFIATGNMLEAVPPPLRDRMEVIEFPGYTEDEKLQIARRFLVPKQRKENGVSGKQITFTAAGLRYVINHYTYEAGVRNLERQIAALCRKTAKRLASGENPSVKADPQTVEGLLGPVMFRHDRRSEQDRVGIAVGLSYTPQGGDIINIEVSVVPGKGNLVLTGQLGDVMKESAQAALGYARLIGEPTGAEAGYFEKHDIHIHVPAGAIPKEGPSAGISICTALISALRQIPVRSAVAMTGEITLHGSVLPIGGVREKVLGAHRAGITKVILPAENAKDLHDRDEVPEEVHKAIEFVFVQTMDEVLKHALVK
ncbi:endopeptidase La [bacterium]|nr:endopeptidase La [bacterium]